MVITESTALPPRASELLYMLHEEEAAEVLRRDAGAVADTSAIYLSGVGLGDHTAAGVPQRA